MTGRARFTVLAIARGIGGSYTAPAARSGYSLNPKDFTLIADLVDARAPTPS